ncbi:DUF3261 domain-containing protein [Minwuia sp.]|uniref:DUF3261 domain-containing protein n=1 Tax=Minwuia sp. TaxID=2493630 RepID=UPI003A8FD149
MQDGDRLTKTDTDLVDIGGGVGLRFPAQPYYPEVTRISQLITTVHDRQQLRFQGDLQLGREAVTAVFSLPGGPPLLTINWTAGGIDVHKTTAVPVGLDGRRVLADIVLSFWPASIIETHLIGGRVADEIGRRTIKCDGDPVIVIDHKGDAARTETRLLNLAQGYYLTIVSKPAAMK